MKQYLDLYRDNLQQLDSHSAPAINDLRLKAYNYLSAHPNYPKEYRDYLSPNYGLNLSRVNLPVDVARSFRCDVPGVTTLLGVVVNDIFIPAAHLAERLPEGVTFMSLAQAAREHPELVARYYGKLAPINDTVNALSTMLVQDGVFIHVDRGVKLDKPLQLVNIFSSPVNLMAMRRVLVVLEEDAEAQLLVCDHTQDSDHDYMSCQVSEIFLGAHSKLEAVTIEESSARTARLASMYSSLEKGSNLTFNSTTLTCGKTRNRYKVTLDGEHCDCHLAGMAIGSGEMVADNATTVVHNCPRCKSNQLFKYVLDQHSRGAFQGKILVTPNAPFTEAYQTNRNLLACGDARMHAEPALEIYNDEVKCSHGAATGQLDEEALFYMRTRGIPLDEARTMLMQAFMVDVIETVHIKGLQDRLRHLVERRFAGKDATCETCQQGGNCK